MGRQTSVGWRKQAMFQINASISLARWRWRLLHYFKQVVNLSATCFHVELEQFSACFRVARVCQRQMGFLVVLGTFTEFMFRLEHFFESIFLILNLNVNWVGLTSAIRKLHCVSEKSSTSYFAEYFCAGLTDCKNFNGYRVRDNQRTQVYNQCFKF